MRIGVTISAPLAIFEGLLDYRNEQEDQYQSLYDGDFEYWTYYDDLDDYPYEEFARLSSSVYDQGGRNRKPFLKDDYIFEGMECDCLECRSI